VGLAALTAPMPTGLPSGPALVLAKLFLRITISTRRLRGLPEVGLFGASGLRWP
jgi:hypothetical protein